jgi:hypothetical protein
MFGLDQLAALRIPFLPDAKKRLILTAYGWSRVEYGMAIGTLTKYDLKSVDSWMKGETGKCLAGNRGLLSMRYCGTVPAAARMQRLCLTILLGLASRADTGLDPSLGTLVFSAAIPHKGSQLQKLIKNGQLVQ